MEESCAHAIDVHESKSSKQKKKHKKDKKRKRDSKTPDEIDDGISTSRKKSKQKESKSNDGQSNRYFPFEYEHIVAPMVGASELAFRLLCRKYGATLAYTPMMSAKQFVEEAAAISSEATVANSNICEFQTIPEDRPLVCHFSANDPQHFANAAKLVEPYCDAVDLNLGCPQRTAFVGHFGSYLLGDEDRQLVLDIIRAGSRAVSIPIFVKIRLLDTIEETIKLCHQLRDAGARLIAIHARYRASWERKGPGARDGPALLDQVRIIKESMPSFPIISNGNIITYEDVVANRQNTAADGVMSAEGLLDNPALYLPRLGDARDKNKEFSIYIPSPLRDSKLQQSVNHKDDRALRKLNKKMRKIMSSEKKLANGGSLDEKQQKLLCTKSSILAEIQVLERSIHDSQQSDLATANHIGSTTIKLRDLAKAADKLSLANEYLSLVRKYPMKIRSVVFHTRRMCKELLEKYQLMNECIACTSIDSVEKILSKCAGYIKHPETFLYDQDKAKKDREALECKRREEGKRKAYEARMIRKAKREGLVDREYYLRIGAEVPSKTTISKLKLLSKEDALAAWKKSHSQHCMSYHLDDGGCKRDRACAFLHSEAKDENKFDEADEVAG